MSRGKKEAQQTYRSKIGSLYALICSETNLDWNVLILN